MCGQLRVRGFHGGVAFAIGRFRKGSILAIGDGGFIGDGAGRFIGGLAVPLIGALCDLRRAVFAVRLDDVVGIGGSRNCKCPGNRC